MLGPTAHEDSFTRDNLPPASEWPQFNNSAPFDYGPYVNAAVELCDKWVAEGQGHRIALIGAGRRRDYQDLMGWTNQLAHTLVEDYGVRPGERIMLRSGNNPAAVACWLAILKAGAVAVSTMPMLRAAELGEMIESAQIRVALVDSRLAEELRRAQADHPTLERIIPFDGSPSRGAELDERALSKSRDFEPVKTGADDVALIAFTSGTTGKPKATMHFHRDILAIADGYAREVLRIQPDDICIGSPPLAFTFGLGGLVIFPMRFGAACALFEDAKPANLRKFVAEYEATVLFTAPTAYRAMLQDGKPKADFASLRIAVSAGETLPKAVFDDWTEKTGIPMLNGIGTTEMLHIFLTTRLDDMAPGTTGRPVKGYEVTLLDEEGRAVPDDTPGRLAVRGPTGCRYLNDPRQTKYVQNGWNITGDTFVRRPDGNYVYQARSDDMIISSGYNIAGPEVENALMSHPWVLECAIVGKEDEERGQIVEAHVVLKDDVSPSDTMVKVLQDHVKKTIAPYKYPRAVQFHESLPKTNTGKLQRYKLKTV